MNFNVGAQCYNFLEHFYNTKVTDLYKKNFFCYNNIKFSKSYNTSFINPKSRSYGNFNIFPKNVKVILNKECTVKNNEQREFCTVCIYNKYEDNNKIFKITNALEKIKSNKKPFNKFEKIKNDSSLDNVEELKKIYITKFKKGSYRKIFNIKYFYVYLVVLLDKMTIEVSNKYGNRVILKDSNFLAFVASEDIYLDINCIDDSHIGLFVFEFEDYEK